VIVVFSTWFLVGGRESSGKNQWPRSCFELRDSLVPLLGNSVTNRPPIRLKNKFNFKDLFEFQ